MKHMFTLLSSFAMAASVVPINANSQTVPAWPNETIHVVVPYAPGGLTDMIGRAFAQELAKSLGSAVIVDNKAGASTQIGTDYVAKAKPDGHTLLIASAPMAISQQLYPKLPYNTSKDFIPISLIAQNGLVLMATNKGFDAKSVADIVSKARKSPGSIGIASVGNGTMGHIAIERLASITGVEFLHVPYKGTAQAFPDLIGGQVPLMLDNLVTALPQIQGGKVRAIAFTGRSRSPQLPNVPTFRELGFTEMEAMNFYGLFAPAGTPPNVIRQLNLEVKRIFSKPEIKQQFVSAGAVVTPGSPQEFSTFLEIQGIVWGAVIRSRGIKPD